MADRTKLIGNDESIETDQSPQSSGEYEYKVSDQCLKEWKSTFETVKNPTRQIPIRKQVTFSWCNINVFTEEKMQTKSTKSGIFSIRKGEATQKHILRNVTGIAYPGELLVVMGSSGAGKTTLMNCMTFRNLKNLTISGLVCVNHAPVSQPQLATQSAYVQQDDMFIKYLTVKEHLIFQSQVRMDPNSSQKERMERVEEVMRELALKKCESCIIGLPGIVKGISGGERKRLALASELLTNPSLLFCDEPTTGLDSFMSLNVVQILRDIARTGTTVIVTLHQPSSELFHMFDKLCLMAQGRLAFLGNIEEASIFFTKLQSPCPKNFNPADHYIQLLSILPGREEHCKKAVNSVCDAFAKSTLGVKIKLETEKTTLSAQDSEDLWSNKPRNASPYRAGWWRQLRALLWRSWMSIIKNPDVTYRRLITTLLESCLMILIYFGQALDQAGIKNIDGVIFFFLMNSTQHVFAVLDTFCDELPLFMKEHKDGMYRTDVYYIAKIVCNMPLAILASILNTTFLYFFVGLNPEIDKYLIALLISVLIGMTAQGAGYIISTIAPNIQIAVPLVSVFMTPLFLFGGIFLSFSSIPSYFEWISELSWIKDGYQAFMINQWSDIKRINCEYNTSAASVCMNNGIEVLESVSVNVGEFWPALKSLIILAVAYRIVGFLILLCRAYHKE